MTRKQTILEREISNFMKQGTGWIVGPETWGQASFRRGSNSRALYNACFVISALTLAAQIL